MPLSANQFSFTQREVRNGDRGRPTSELSRELRSRLRDPEE